MELHREFRPKAGTTSTWSQGTVSPAVTNSKSFTALESYEVSEQFASLVHEEICNLHKVALVVCWCVRSTQPHLVGEFSPTYLRNRKNSWKSLENRHKKLCKTECSSQPLLTGEKKKKKQYTKQCTIRDRGRWMEALISNWGRVSLISQKSLGKQLSLVLVSKRHDVVLRDMV